MVPDPAAEVAAFDKALGDVDGIKKYSDVHDALIAEEASNAWDRKAKQGGTASKDVEPERSAATIVRAIRGYERKTIFGDLASESSSKDAPPAYTPGNGLQAPIMETPRSASATSDADPYAFLKSFDTVFLIDDSGSRAGRSWKETGKALEAITPICTQRDANGATRTMDYRSEMSALRASREALSLSRRRIREVRQTTCNAEAALMDVLRQSLLGDRNDETVDPLQQAYARVEDVLAMLQEYEEQGLNLERKTSTMEWQYMGKEAELYQSDLTVLLQPKVENNLGNSLRSPGPTPNGLRPPSFAEVPLSKTPDPALDPAGYLRSIYAARERSKLVLEKAKNIQLQHVGNRDRLSPGNIITVADPVMPAERRSRTPGLTKFNQTYKIPSVIASQHNVDALGDYCAKYNFMSPKYAKRVGLTVNRTDLKSVSIGSGKRVWTLGSVETGVSFKCEADLYAEVFHILPGCIHDVIFGKPFLMITKTFSSTVNRVRRVVKRVAQSLLPHNFCFLGTSAPSFAGLLDNQRHEALADSGCKIPILDEEFARSNGFLIHEGLENRTKIRYADGSPGVTSGMVYGVRWRFGPEGASEEHILDFHVLKNAPAPIILSEDFLFTTDAFAEFDRFLLDKDDEVEDEAYFFAIDTEKGHIKDGMLAITSAVSELEQC
jgi:hypothetical protein